MQVADQYIYRIILFALWRVWLVLGPLLLTWINFNPSMDKYLHTQKNVGEITYPFLNFNGATVDVQEWISKFIPHFMMDVITYPCWD